MRNGVLLIAFAATLWGTIGIATKALYGLADTNPLSVGFLRLTIATPALLLACWLMLGRTTFDIRRRDLGLMVLIGAAMALYQVGYFAAIPRVGVAIAVLVAIGAAPVLVAMLSAGLLRERPTGQVLVALAGALAGIVLLVGVQPANGDGPAESAIGVLLALAAALGYAAVVICSRSLAGRYHPLQPIAIGFGAGAALLLPFALATGLVVDYPPAGWALLLHLGLVPTALAYVIFLCGIRTTTATAASIAGLFEPLTSVVLAWLLFGERLGPTGLIGGALLLGAVTLLYRSQARPAAAVAG